MVKRLIGVFQRYRDSAWKPADNPDDYSSWIAQRVRDRSARYRLPSDADPPRIDILTLVHDTEPGILCKTAASVLAQDYEDYRWLIWDNGSVRGDTRDVLAELARMPRVVIGRSDENLGITGGHAVALALAGGEYIALLDHDDCLYHDALRIAATFIRGNENPAFLYSDEDKIDRDDRPFCPFFKPDWSPAFLQATGFICHLSLFRRQRACELQLFSDSRVEGSQDWDAAMRMHDAGESGVHIPEVLYSWRVLPHSTSGVGAAAKPYVVAGQRAVLEASLKRRGLHTAFRVEPNELFGTLSEGHWQIKRARRELPPLDVVIVTDSHDDYGHELDAKHEAWLHGCKGLRAVIRPLHAGGEAGRRDWTIDWLQLTGEPWRPGEHCHSLAEALNHVVQSSGNPFLACIPAGVTRLSQDWLAEGVGQLELNRDADIVGGRVLDSEDRVVRGETVLGLGELLGTPYRGQPGTHLGYFGLSLDTHNLACLWRVPWVARRAALRDNPFDDVAFPEAYFEPDLCLRLAADGRQTVFNPHMTAHCQGAEAARAGDAAEGLRFWERHHLAFRSDPYYSPSLSLDPQCPYRTGTQPERHGVLRELESSLREAALYALDAKEGNVPL
jgi:glycosyltransferase involved in cell wall biosynthesis